MVILVLLKDGSNVKVQAISTGANVTGNLAATGNVTAVDGTFTGNLTVQGTTTTIDTAVTSVDSLAVDGQITGLGNFGIGTATQLLHLSIHFWCLTLLGEIFLKIPLLEGELLESVHIDGINLKFSPKQI